MKKLILALSIVLLLASCATVPVQNPVCPQEGSWICDRSAQLGIQPEQLYGWIYDAAVVAAVTDVVEIQELCEFEQKIADWYIAGSSFSYTALINEMIFRVTLYDRKKMMLIASALNHYLWEYRSTELISPADDLIFKKGHKAFRRDMLCDY